MFSLYSATLINGPLLGRAKSGQISKVVTLSRWSGHILWPSGNKSYGYQDVKLLNLAHYTKRMVWLTNLTMVWISNQTMVWLWSLQLIEFNLTCLKNDQICDILTLERVVRLAKWPFAWLSRWRMIELYKKTKMGRSKSGLIRWSDCQGGHIPRFHCI